MSIYISREEGIIKENGGEAEDTVEGERADRHWYLRRYVGPAPIAQSGYVRLGALLLLGFKKWRNISVVPTPAYNPTPRQLTLSMSKGLWDNSPSLEYSSHGTEWRADGKRKGVSRSDGGTAEAGDPPRKQNQTALVCDGHQKLSTF